VRAIRRWIAARLWRRLAFSHFAIIFVTLLVLQLVIAGLVALTVRGTAPVEGDAVGADAEGQARRVGEDDRERLSFEDGDAARVGAGRAMAVEAAPGDTAREVDDDDRVRTRRRRVRDVGDAGRAALQVEADIVQIRRR